MLVAGGHATPNPDLDPKPNPNPNQVRSHARGRRATRIDDGTHLRHALRP